MDSLPTLVNAARKVLLGTYRGLRFGMVLHPHFAPEVFLEGATTCVDTLNRDHHGPRAVLNSLERLVKQYPSEVEHARKNLALAESQLRDFQNRHGLQFAHESYLRELTELRDQLKAGLSANPPEGTPPTAEVAEKIKALKASNTVDAPAPARAERKMDAEEPVTRRIMRQREEEPTPSVTPIAIEIDAPNRTMRP